MNDKIKWLPPCPWETQVRIDCFPSIHGCDWDLKCDMPVGTKTVTWGTLGFVGML